MSVFWGFIRNEVFIIENEVFFIGKYYPLTDDFPFHYNNATFGYFSFLFVKQLCSIN